MYKMGRLRCLLAAAANRGAADPPGPAAVAAPWGSARKPVEQLSNRCIA